MGCLCCCKSSFVKAWFAIFAYSLLSQCVSSLTFKNGAKDDATAYTLPQVSVIAEYATQAQLRITSTSDTLQGPLQKQTEIYLAVYMFREFSVQQSLNFGKLVSFSLDAKVYTLPYNETHTLLQADLQGNIYWLDQPAKSDVTTAMLDLYQQAFMTKEGVGELQNRFQDELGLEGVEILRTRVQDRKYNTRTGKTSGEKPQGAAPANPDASPSSPETSESSSFIISNYLLIFIAVILVALSLLLAVFAICVSKRKYQQRVRAENAKVTEKQAEAASLPTDPGGEDVESVVSNYSGGDAGLLPGKTDKDRPDDLLRGWASPQEPSQFVQNVRNSRALNTFLKVVGLETPADPEQADKGNFRQNERERILNDGTAIERSEKLVVPKYKKDIFSMNSAKLEQNLDDLYSLSFSNIQQAAEDQKVIEDDEPENGEILDVDVLAVSAVHRLTRAHSAPLSDRLGSSTTEKVSDDRPLVSSLNTAHSKTPGEAEQARRDDLMRAWNRVEEKVCADKKTLMSAPPISIDYKTDSNVSDLMRGWKYDDGRSVGHISSSEESKLRNSGVAAAGTCVGPTMTEKEAGTIFERLVASPAADESGFVLPTTKNMSGSSDEHTEPTMDVSYETEAGASSASFDEHSDL
ncbi:hypothetical protein MPSEU_000848800 [Mayamaea pseudoterrestris]|nr:hypothetical protein MPSEU_000848800 [Mayamaea pseudoterrestris]